MVFSSPHLVGEAESARQFDACLIAFEDRVLKRPRSSV
jgi:hypothetical protein